MDTNTLLHSKDWKVLLENLEASTSQVEKGWEAVKELFASHLHNYEQFLQRMNVLEIDEKGVIQYANEVFCQRVGRSTEEIVGRELNSLIKSSPSAPWLKEDQEPELCFDGANGESIWIKVFHVTPEKKNEPYLLFGVDITAYVQENLVAMKVKEDFWQTMEALINLAFKVKRVGNSYYYTMFEGKLARDIGLTTEVVNGRILEDIFGEEKSQFYKEKYTLGFSGEVVSYKHYYQGRAFFTTLSPVEENQEVVEVIGSTVEITSYEEAESRIEHMASHDPLTDLPNRIKLQSDLDENLGHKAEVTVIFCNLDRFKYVNDAFGHFAGDQVIQMMAKRLEGLTPGAGQVYRVGGDEFIIALYGSYSKEATHRLSNQMLQSISKPIRLFGKQFFMTASLGIAHYPTDAAQQTELIMNADVAMQYGKMHGRQQVSFYTRGMNRDYDQLISLEGDLREAISKNELTLNYQPKVDVSTGYVSGMEALVRWEHPEKGTISPGQFIPIAEEAGIIAQLDEWVMREACRQNQRWIDQGYAPERVAVNVSANEIQRDDFAAKVKSILHETKLNPKFLEIEVTEESVMQNTAQCILTMQDLKTLGISLSIDDFGTGYSSLSYLRKFPIHYLKIDQAFIRGVLTDPSDAEIVKAMIQLADAFKLEVVAEGVEGEEVLNFLKENQCSHYQGYYFSKPLPPEEMERLLTKKQLYQ